MVNLKVKGCKGVLNFLNCLDFSKLESSLLFESKKNVLNFLKQSNILIDKKQCIFIVRGPLGIIKISFNLLGLYYDNSLGYFILKDKAMLGRMLGILYQASFGVMKGYHTEIELRGLGFSGFVSGNFLFLDLGFCHWICLKVPSCVSLKFLDKYHLLVRSFNYQVFSDFLVNFNKVGCVNIYTGMGLRLGDKFYRSKVGKVRDN